MLNFKNYWYGKNHQKPSGSFSTRTLTLSAILNQPNHLKSQNQWKSENPYLLTD